MSGEPITQQRMIQPEPDKPCQYCGATEHKSPVRCFDDKECPHCGGLHWGSIYCPYSVTQEGAGEPIMRADHWKPPATLEELAAEWANYDEKYHAWSEAAGRDKDLYGQGSFEGRSISYGICAAQLRAALSSGSVEVSGPRCNRMIGRNTFCTLPEGHKGNCEWANPEYARPAQAEREEALEKVIAKFRQMASETEDPELGDILDQIEQAVQERQSRLTGLVREMKYSAETLLALGDKPAAKLTAQWADNWEAALSATPAQPTRVKVTAPVRHGAVMDFDSELEYIKSLDAERAAQPAAGPGEKETK